MPILTLKFKDKIITEYNLKKGAALTIGRRDTNNIIIENLAVSGEHAKIDSIGDGFLLTDLQSKNGTFVNEQRITSHYLKQNDAVIIGKHTLVFEYKDGESEPDNAAQDLDLDKTMVMDTGQYKKMLSQRASDMDAKKPAIMREGVLTFLTGGEGDLKISKKLTKIGKDSSCDIVVSGFLIAKTAATISKRPNGFYISYVGGMFKPKINGKTVKESVMLKEFDIIEMGATKMQFVYKG